MRNLVAIVIPLFVSEINNDNAFFDSFEGTQVAIFLAYQIFH
jgi:hypothetical protein